MGVLDAHRLSKDHTRRCHLRRSPLLWRNPAAPVTCWSCSRGCQTRVTHVGCATRWPGSGGGGDRGVGRVPFLRRDRGVGRRPARGAPGPGRTRRDHRGHGPYRVTANDRRARSSLKSPYGVPWWPGQGTGEAIADVASRAAAGRPVVQTTGHDSYRGCPWVREKWEYCRAPRGGNYWMHGVAELKAALGNPYQIAMSIAEPAAGVPQRLLGRSRGRVGGCESLGVMGFWGGGAALRHPSLRERLQTSTYTLHCEEQRKNRTDRQSAAPTTRLTARRQMKSSTTNVKSNRGAFWAQAWSLLHAAKVRLPGPGRGSRRAGHPRLAA